MESENAGMGLQNPLTKRLISAAVISGITLYLIFWAPFFIFFVGGMCVILLCLNEFFTLVQKNGLPVNKPLGLSLGALIPFGYFLPAEPAVILIAMFVLFLSEFNRHAPHSSNALTLTALTVFGLIYIAWMISYFLKLRGIPGTGSLWVFFVVSVVKFGDAGAYFIGKKWGKRKLISHISPGKSVEGALGCTAVTILFSLLGKLYLPNVAIGHFIVMGLGLSVFAQVGDLVESLIKRNLGAKDSGEIPGLGGMLDVMDSLLFSAPFVYYYAILVIGVTPS